MNRTFSDDSLVYEKALPGSYMDFVICMVRSYHLFTYCGLGASYLDKRRIASLVQGICIYNIFIFYIACKIYCFASKVRIIKYDF